MDIDLMVDIAQPLDDWCELCNMKMATMRSADGVGACQDCAEALIARAKGPSRSQRRAFARSMKKRGKGWTR